MRDVECGKHIDEDAIWCMDCIEKALAKGAKYKVGVGRLKIFGHIGQLLRGEILVHGKERYLPEQNEQCV